MKKIFVFTLLLILILTTNNLCERETEFEKELELLKSPKELMLLNKEAKIRIGDKFYLPQIEMNIIPTDEQENYINNAKIKFDVENTNILRVSDNGFVEAIADGDTNLKINYNGIIDHLNINISNKNTPLSIQNLIYIGKREFYQNKMSRLPKYNQYAKWYYKKKKEVGWCSVFTSYCTNAAGLNTFKYNTIDKDSVNKNYVFGLLEGQVGHQWDGFSAVNRFTNIPKPGYYVIYGNIKNEYKFTHIGLVVDVQECGEGKYIIQTVEGNMSNTVKSYMYLYDSNIAHPKKNIFEIPIEKQTSKIIQYKEHTGYWSVFGFCATWE